MKPKGVLFSGLMVNTILAGTKTQTRRIIKPKPVLVHNLQSRRKQKRGDLFIGPDLVPASVPNRLVFAYAEGTASTRILGSENFIEEFCPYPVGSICYVKETHYRWGKWVKSGLTKKGNQAWRFKVIPYSGRGPGILWAADCPVIPSIKRTKIGWHKRPAIFMPKLPARLWLEVTAVRAERLKQISMADVLAEGCILSTSKTEPLDYENLWESINGKGSWSQNPFVWVFGFRRIERPKDL